MDAKSQKNSLGPIAKNYAELHGLTHFWQTRDAGNEAASGETALKAVFQATEVALLNLADLTRRVSDDLAKDHLLNVVAKLDWIAHFHHLLSRIAQMPDRIHRTGSHPRVRSRGSFVGSPALGEFVQASQRFDESLECWLGRTNSTYESVIADDSPHNINAHLIQRIKVAAYSARLWEAELASLTCPVEPDRFSEWIHASNLRAMVHDMVLSSDTYFLQFRGLHQIPEILATEGNAQFVRATQAILIGDFVAAHEPFLTATVLTDGVVASLEPLIACMTTGDYHHIRENLGATSGTHSSALNDVLFDRGYWALIAALSKWTHLSDSASDASETKAAPRHETIAGFEPVMRLARTHRAQQLRWRDLHLALPRHNLGTGNTASMIGNPNGVHTVEKLREVAILRDQKAPLWNDDQERLASNDGPLGSYLASPHSVYSQLMKATGVVTRLRFANVQRAEHLGKCPFSEHHAPPDDHSR